MYENYKKYGPYFNKKEQRLIIILVNGKEKKRKQYHIRNI
jgi:hypothetical protein